MVSMDNILVHNSRDKGKALNANGGSNPDRAIINGDQSSAENILRGGNGQSIAGHGTHGFQTGTMMTVPEGTSIIAIPHGKKLSDTAGRFIESTNLDKLSRLNPNERMSMVNRWAKQHNISDLDILNRVKEDVRSLQIYPSNSQMPNYTISPPEKLTIYQKSTTVNKPTTLREIVEPNQGCIGLATCTKIIYTK